MRASACVGRVGGLAVALGIGAAVAVGYAAPTVPGSASVRAAGPAARVSALKPAAAVPEAPAAVAAPVKTAQSTAGLAAVALINDIPVRRPAASRIAAKTASANSANPIPGRWTLASSPPGVKRVPISGKSGRRNTCCPNLRIGARR